MFKKRIIPIAAIVFFLFFLLLSNSISSNNPSDPFEIYAYLGIWWGTHEQIVQAALEPFKNKGGVTQGAIDDLIEGVRDPDPEDIFEFIEGIWEENLAAHWNIPLMSGTSYDSIWNSSAKHIRDKISQAIWGLCNGYSYLFSRFALGQAFHTVADFFSHTNWVDVKGRSIEGLVFEEGKKPPDFTWQTIKTNPYTVIHRDTPGDPTPGYGFDLKWDEAHADAIAMTRKEYHNFEKQLFNTYPGSASAILKEFLGGGDVHPVLWIIWIWDPEAGSWPCMSLDSTWRISWEHCGINPNSQVKISLLKYNVWIGDIAEVTLDERYYDWIVGDYYTLNGGVKEWHKAEAIDSAGYRIGYQIKITSLDTNIETVSGTFQIDSGEATSSPPSAPGSLNAEWSWSSFEVKLSWGDTSNNEQEFIIERKSEWEPSWQEIGRVGSNTRWYNDPDVICDTFYWYRVSAYNSYGYSDYSNVVQIYVPWY